MTYPVLLAHGVCRFDVLWKDRLAIDNADDPAVDKYHYFRGIRTMLRSKGYEAYHSSVPWASPVQDRADQLRRNVLSVLDLSGAERVNIIAHSMGGLDARHMMFDDREGGRIHERVASLITISTPHEGSPFADWGLTHVPKLVPLASKLGLDIRALEDLTVEACTAHNRREDVREFEDQLATTLTVGTYAGEQNLAGTWTLLKPSHRIISKAEGENDGLVSVRSAMWRDAFFRGVIPETDHINEVGWWDLDQTVAGEGPGAMLERIHGFYEEVVAGLP